MSILEFIKIYWVWIVTWLLFLILIIVLIIIARIIYRKVSVARFLEENKNASPKKLKTKYIENEIENLEKKVKGKKENKPLAEPSENERNNPKKITSL